MRGLFGDPPHFFQPMPQASKPEKMTSEPAERSFSIPAVLHRPAGSAALPLLRASQGPPERPRLLSRRFPNHWPPGPTCGTLGALRGTLDSFRIVKRRPQAAHPSAGRARRRHKPPKGPPGPAAAGPRSEAEGERPRAGGAPPNPPGGGPPERSGGHRDGPAPRRERNRERARRAHPEPRRGAGPARRGAGGERRRREAGAGGGPRSAAEGTRRERRPTGRATGRQRTPAGPAGPRRPAKRPGTGTGPGGGIPQEAPRQRRGAPARRAGAGGPP